ncbi:GNAT family N-acetyltransferase [Vibrio mexicanus]|uniref:GNAT family N-acetyltransferase n=1 Tax=Vibrio mexicanus TaxID=1004326 RepID=UPI000AF2BE2A|nr:GNAT family N-acetyltransferase [Vibrio mexicanus]
MRDLQVTKEYQGKGIGAKALKKVLMLAIDAGADSVRLRVFKISPARHLYQREGYAIDKEEERFYYMSRPVN